MKKIIPSAMKPLTSGNEIDLDSAASMYEFNIGHKIYGFFIFGI